MTPSDFEFDLLAHAHALYTQAQSYSASHTLDPKTCVWLVTYDAWRRAMQSPSIANTLTHGGGRKDARWIYGIHVRVTIEDEEGTPPIQLLMEPLVRRRARV